MNVDKGLLAKILVLVSFILFVIAAVQAAYSTLTPWLVPGGLAAFALAALLS